MNIKTLLENIELEQVIINAIEKHNKTKEKAKVKEERDEKEKHLVIRGKRQRIPKFTKEEQRIKKLARNKIYYAINKDKLIQQNTDNYYLRKEKNNKKTID